jgi:TspO/MBR family
VQEIVRLTGATAVESCAIASAMYLLQQVRTSIAFFTVCSQRMARQSLCCTRTLPLTAPPLRIEAIAHGAKWASAARGSNKRDSNETQVMMMDSFPGGIWPKAFVWAWCFLLALRARIFGLLDARRPSSKGAKCAPHRLRTSDLQCCACHVHASCKGVKSRQPSTCWEAASRHGQRCAHSFLQQRTFDRLGRNPDPPERVISVELDNVGVVDQPVGHLVIAIRTARSAARTIAAALAAAQDALRSSRHARLGQQQRNMSPPLERNLLCSSRGFNDRKKPDWCPPGYVFAIVWSTIAGLRATAGVLVWEACGCNLFTAPLIVYGTHLVRCSLPFAASAAPCRAA